MATLTGIPPHYEEFLTHDENGNVFVDVKVYYYFFKKNFFLCFNFFIELIFEQQKKCRVRVQSGDAAICRWKAPFKEVYPEGNFKIFI